MYSNNSYDPNHGNNHRYGEYQQDPRRTPYQENQYSPRDNPYCQNPERRDSFGMVSDIKNPCHENQRPYYENNQPSFHNDQQSPYFDNSHHFTNQHQERYSKDNQPPQYEDNHYPYDHQYPYHSPHNQNTHQYPHSQQGSPQSRLQSLYEDSHYPFSKHQREISNNFRHSPPYQENRQTDHPDNGEQVRENSFGLRSDIKNPYHESQLASQRSQNHYNQDQQKSRRDSSEATGSFTSPPQKSHRSRENTQHYENDDYPRNSKREYFQVPNSPYEQETPSSNFHKNLPTIEVNTPVENHPLKRTNSFEVITNFKPEVGSPSGTESSYIPFPNFIHHLRVQSQDQSNPLSPHSPALDLNDILNFGQAQELRQIETEQRNILTTTENHHYIQTIKTHPVPIIAIPEKSSLPPPQTVVENAKQSPPNRHFKICLILTSIYIILGFTLTIALLVYHFDKNKTDFTPISGALQYISFNLNAVPLMELQLVDKGSSCPTGLSSLSIGTWSGTVWGCNCANALKREVCSYSESKSCSLVFPYSERNLYDWRESLWCGRRAEIGTELVKKKTCPTGYMQCSPGICVVTPGSCPITSISISSKTSSNGFGDSSRKYLTVKSTLGEDPLIDINISPNSIPCFSDGYYSTGDTETYILLRDRETGCSKYGLDSENSISIDEKTQYDVFSVDNSFSTTLFNLLVGYKSITQNTNAVLSSRKRIDVTNNDDCLTLDSEKFQAPISSYNNLRKALTVTSIIAISLLGTFILVSLGLTIHLRHSMRKLPLLEAIKQKRTKGILLFASIFAIFGVAINTIIFILVAIHRSGMMETYEDYKTLKDDCFSGKPALVLQDYQDFVDTVVKKIYRLALALLVIAWTTMTPALILLYKHIFFNRIYLVK